ncbi:MAG: flagellar basal-body MS-ring/collar protein FliF [Candidatus Zixiibacteriota bacterium]
MNDLKSGFKNFSAYVANMTASQVMMLFGLAGGTIVGIFFVVGWVKDVNYARLYTHLDEGEAGEIVSYLGDQKIPYKLTDNGTSIEVPSDQVYKTRISLAAEGLPKGGVMGYSIFDKNNLGMTDFLQNLNFRRALEGELTKTIMQLSEVQAARVHIVIPKDRLFKEDKREATASVLLKLKGHSQLGRQQVNGITHLVASSVEGLSPGNITIVDYEGNLISGGQKADPLAGMSSSQLDVRQQVEKYLEEKAQSMLDGVLGPGKAIVRVTAELNFQQLERTEEKFDPDNSQIRSEEHTKTTNNSSNKAQDSVGSSQQENSETYVTNYELNKTVEHIVNAVGTINRLSVAVTVDGTYSEQAAGGEAGEKVYQPRSQEELDRLAAVVRNAVGFDSQRNDQIELFNVPFNRDQIQVEQQQLDTMYQREFYWEIAKKVGIVLLVIMALLYLKRKSKKLFSALGQILPPSVPRQVRAQAQQGGEEESGPIAMEPRKPRLVDQMQHVAKEKPEEVAKVIKTLMIE